MPDRPFLGTSLRISYPELQSHLGPWNLQKPCQRCACEALRFFGYARSVFDRKSNCSCCSNQAVQPKMEESCEESQEERNDVEMRPDEVRCNPEARQPDIDRDAAFQGLLADSKRLCDSFSTLCGLPEVELSNSQSWRVVLRSKENNFAGIMCSPPREYSPDG